MLEKLNRATFILSLNRRFVVGMVGLATVGCMYMLSRAMSATTPEPPKKLRKLKSNRLNTELNKFENTNLHRSHQMAPPRSDVANDNNKSSCEIVAPFDVNCERNEDKTQDCETLDGSLKLAMQKRNVKKEKKLPPNYFMAIVTKLKSIQENIVKQKPDLKHALIPAETFHLTLCVLRIDGEDELKKVDRILESCEEKLRENNDLRKIFLTIQGLDCFRNQVVFAKVNNDDNFAQLEKLADTVVSCFDGSKMLIKDHDKFTPHLTIAKMSKAPFLRKKNIKIISRDSYAHFSEDTFGVEEIDSIQLLLMSQPKAQDGYYSCRKEIPLIDST